MLSVTNRYKWNNIDIGSMMADLENNSINYNMDNLRKTIEEMIIYNRIGSAYKEKKSIGLSFYLPAAIPSINNMNVYRNVAFSPYMLNYIELMRGHMLDPKMEVYKGNNWEKSELFYEESFEYMNYEDITLDDEETYNLIQSCNTYSQNNFANNWYVLNKKSNTSKDELKRECENSNDRFFVCFDDSENIYSIYSTLCFEKDGQVISLGEQAEVSYDVNNREYSSNFTGEWYGLPDGQLLTTYVIDKGEGVIVYGIPVVINEVESIIRIEEREKAIEKKEYSILGVWDATNNSSYAPRGYLPLEKGTEIIPIYDVYNESEGIYDTTYGEGYIIQSDYDFMKLALPNGDYSYGFIINEYMKKEYTTTLKEFAMKNGKLFG